MKLKAEQNSGNQFSMKQFSKDIASCWNQEPKELKNLYVKLFKYFSKIKQFNYKQCLTINVLEYGKRQCEFPIQMLDPQYDNIPPETIFGEATAQIPAPQDMQTETKQPQESQLPKDDVPNFYVFSPPYQADEVKDIIKIEKLNNQIINTEEPIDLSTISEVDEYFEENPEENDFGAVNNRISLKSMTVNQYLD
ncbi:UNKNOWN [Stylonychia lemnae]|uniref:Uncharacterized protein n=1 Tax=Stylonychia lemnae TaxID=5949 RepID=A0A078AE24_STYLE|nr:UNKNOWN [Stylonychia lemnae]|eukprot:CDW79772.1 UNKNOWN [Stylonychia lemnae]